MTKLTESEKQTVKALEAKAREYRFGTGETSIYMLGAADMLELLADKATDLFQLQDKKAIKAKKAGKPEEPENPENE